MEITDQPNRLETHQAILTALETDDPDERTEALRDIIRYAVSLPVSGKYEAVAYRIPKDDSAVTGHTEEMGDVTIHEESDKPNVWGHEIQKDRVGHYRLWRPESGVVIFHHYWASDITTAVSLDRPNEHVIFYDHLSLEPTCFGTYEPDRLVEINLLIIHISIQFYVFHTLWGRAWSNVKFNIRIM